MVAELVTAYPSRGTPESTYDVVGSRLNLYLAHAWWSAKSYPPSPSLPDLSPKDEYGYRGAGMAALGLAAYWYTGRQDTALTPFASTRALQLTNAAAAEHGVNAGSGGWGGGWGDQWQGAYWAALNGLASWLLWAPFLNTTALREPVARMVEYEANRLLDMVVPVWTRADGVVLTPGDSKHEENGWNSTALALAAAMMPGHPNAEAWTAKAVQFVMSGNAVEDDLSNAASVNGRPVSEWCEAGWNVQDDYTVINHDRVHPDYMQTVILGLQSALVYALVGRPAPLGLAWNAFRIYRALQTVELGSPARTMYQHGSPFLYYPQGGDWGWRRSAGYACLDTAVDALLPVDPWGGPGLPWPASYWEDLHIGDCFDMQIRPSSSTRPNGILVETGNTQIEDKYRARVEWSAGHFGLALLIRWVQSRGLFQWHNQPV